MYIVKKSEWLYGEQVVWKRLCSKHSFMIVHKDSYIIKKLFCVFSFFLLQFYFQTLNVTERGRKWYLFKEIFCCKNQNWSTFRGFFSHIYQIVSYLSQPEEKRLIDLFYIKYTKVYLNQISMSKKCLCSDVEMIFVTRCLLDVEFRLWTDIPPISMSIRCWIRL